MYVDPNFKTKKALKEAVEGGADVYVFSPGPFPVPKGTVSCSVEGPHYPKPHTWYAMVMINEHGRVMKVIS